jgi:hypothetical protein
MSIAERFRAEWLFASLVAAFGLIYLIWYPASYSIEDEAHILSLAYSLEHGSIFPDHAGPDAGLPVDGHLVSKFSIVHAGLLVPAVATDWRLGFLVTAGFLVAGAFVVRSMLQREGLDSGWSALYFLLLGALFYSQTLLAAVPAAVFGLIAVSMLMRSEPRPVAAGLFFGISVLMHPWMAPLAIVAVGVWCIEQGTSNLASNASRISLGAAPAVATLAAINYASTGNPMVNTYTLLNHQSSFTFDDLIAQTPFYLGSLAIFPLAGWAILSPKWSRGWTLPITAYLVVALASMYGYRDGLNVGSARVGRVLALAAGAIPGQRFLIPVSMLACVPAARFLSACFASTSDRYFAVVRAMALAGFAVVFAALSLAHRNYQRAHFDVQTALHRVIPPDARVVVSPELLKEFAPVDGLYNHVEDTDSTPQPAAGAYFVLLSQPQATPSAVLLDHRRNELVKVRSWIWNRDLWLAWPKN